ncbi:MAG: PD40 domain-containing protein [Bacteroidales bacterium]|nr:PD40 domain-containing protein [Bacteroidales bacterium]
MNKFLSLTIIICSCLLSAHKAAGQTQSDGAAQNERRADSLYRIYEFSRAAKIYSQMAETATGEDKNRLELKAIACQNGEAMLHYVSNPTVVTRKTLDKKDFFLHYPDISSIGHFTLRTDATGTFSDTLFVPENKNTLYYSARDNSGKWSIFVSKKQEDGNWGQSEILGKNINSNGNELFPFVSADGRRLYFSSNGHYGAGGYDLYVSYWDDDQKEWGVAQNMGFPYYSPGDDLFFYITPDGKYAAFSSNRLFNDPTNRMYSTTRIVCYVVEFDSDPIKHPATPKETYEIARLRSSSNLTQKQRDSIATASVDKALAGVDRKTGISEMDPNTRQITERYTQTVLRYRQLKKTQQSLQSNQDKYRNLYSALEQRIAVTKDSIDLEFMKDSLQSVAQTISESEATALNTNNQIREAEAEIRRIEEIFLSTGVSVPENTLFSTSDELAAEAENDNTDESEDIDFNSILDKRAKVVSDPDFRIEKAKSKADLTFKIQKKSTIADLNDFPDGLKYQIKLTSSTKQLDEKAFKGISPVFERKDGGRFVYSAGAFSSYAEANKQLARVKKAGFASASIIAFQDGRAIPLASARKTEASSKQPDKTGKASAYNVCVYTTGSSLESDIMKALSSGGKDVAKVATEDGFKFIAGPFSNQKEANALAEKLKDISDKKISVEAVY